MYNPSLFEVVFWAMPVAVSVTVTDAPAIRAPVESATCPESDAFAVCAFRAFGAAPSNMQAHIARTCFTFLFANLFRHSFSSLLRRPSGVRITRLDRSSRTVYPKMIFINKDHVKCLFRNFTPYQRAWSSTRRGPGVTPHHSVTSFHWIGPAAESKEEAEACRSFAGQTHGAALPSIRRSKHRPPRP